MMTREARVRTRNMRRNDEDMRRGSGLMSACWHGHSETVAALIAGGAGVNISRRRGATPLYIACQRGHTKIVAMLCGAGAAVDQAVDSGATPLYIACENGHLGVVQTLELAGASVGLTAHDGASPLFIACQNGHASIVSMLVAKGSAVGVTKINGATPLCIACEMGHADIVNTLCAAGAAIDQCKKNGADPLFIATYFGHLDALQVLYSYGASTNRLSYQLALGLAHGNILDWLFERHMWNTPLHYLRIISTERARSLLRSGSDLHASAEAGGPTPLSLALALVRTLGDAVDGSAAQIVVEAAAPWSTRTHELFPPAGRAIAVELMLLGHRLSRQERFFQQESALVDVWMALIVPLAVDRSPASLANSQLGS